MSGVGEQTTGSGEGSDYRRIIQSYITCGNTKKHDEGPGRGDESYRYIKCSDHAKIQYVFTFTCTEFRTVKIL